MAAQNQQYKLHRFRAYYSPDKAHLWSLMMRGEYGGLEPPYAEQEAALLCDRLMPDRTIDRLRQQYSQEQEL
jgi:hypothetical protein